MTLREWFLEELIQTETGIAEASPYINLPYERDRLHVLERLLERLEWAKAPCLEAEVGRDAQGRLP